MILLTSLLATFIRFAPAPELSQNPSIHPLNSFAVGGYHAPFSALLRAHVRGGLVDYDAFAKSSEFPRYLQTLSTTRLDPMSRDERLAFWINVYNAYTIHLINLHKERDSIRNINKLFGLVKGKGPWSEPVVRAAGRTLTLDDVEHKIIRVEFQEPRIHAAVVCAALSCPPLRSEAFEGASLDAQLEAQTRTFLRAQDSANRLDVAAGILYLSPIFDWYRADFGKTDAAILKFVAPYFDGVGQGSALASPRLKIEFSNYDWSLNILKAGKTQ
jgi:hypothetical protein